jgi:2-polyprenyl-6-methoxyphenol hydroxylase-like FAD-dependent oxidoreductase
VLSLLGLLDRILGVGAILEVGEIRTSRDRLLARTPLLPVATPTLCVHRRDLHAALHAGVPVRFSAQCVDVERDPVGATVVLASGERVRGDVVMGADGISSAVQRALHKRSFRTAARYGTWRGIASIEATPRGHAVQYLGRGCEVGLVPLAAGRTYWFATRRELDADTSKEGALRQVARFAEPVPRVVEATPESALRWDPIEDLETLPTWVDGRVALLGDAAHATTPHLGQGACLALEDVVVVARTLSASPDPAEALRRYEEIRRPRVERIVRLSRRLGWLNHLHGPVTCWLRDVITWLTPTRVTLAMLRPILHFDAAEPK